MPHYIIVGEQAVPADEVSQPINRGLERIQGKSTKNDHKYVQKVDPSMIAERKNGETISSECWRPILTYGDIRRHFWFDGMMFNVISGAIGAGVVASLYYWGFIKIFAN